MNKRTLSLREWIFIAAILLLTVAVSVLAILLAVSCEEQDERSYYEIKCEAFGVQNANLAKGQIVFIGDSITDLYTLDTYYSDLPLAVYNRGIGGDTTQGVLNRLQGSLFDIAPSKIVLMIGTNDINGGSSDTEILDNYEAILLSVKEKLPSTEIYCMSVIPQNEKLEEYTTLDISETTEKIKRINPLIESLATEYGATYVNLFPYLSDTNDRLIAEYSDDGLHLNAEGYEIWTSILKPYLD